MKPFGRTVWGGVSGLVGMSVLGLLVIGTYSGPASADTPVANTARLHEVYGRLPLGFEANQGQTDNRVQFLHRGSGYTLFLTPTEMVFAWRQQPVKTVAQPVQPDQTVLRVQFLGANRAPSARGLEELPGRVHYFIGKDQAKWRINVSTYAKVRYEDLYPRVDIVYFGNQGQLEYDFIVSPGGDPGSITLGFSGADRVELDPQGDLVLYVASRKLHMKKPFIYQEHDGVRRPISGGYVLTASHQVGFQVGHYDPRLPLVIDPTLFFSTYLGGSGDDQGWGLAVDASGNAYVTGQTASPNFPTTGGVAQASFGGATDAFIAKLNPTGSALVYSTYLGGSGNDVARGIAVDGFGNAYATGGTASSNFPTTAGAFKTALGGALDNAFVTKLNTTGSLVYSTYLGGSNTDIAFAIAVDAGGNAYVTGKASSVDYPTTLGVFEPVMLGSGGSAFVTKLNATGSGLVYSTFLSAVADISTGFGIGVDGSGNAYVTGSSASGSYPTTIGAFQTTFGGGANDTFVTKLNPTGSSLVYSTFLGGNASDNVHGLAVDASGNAYVTGATNSTNFPTTSGAFQTIFNGVADAFVTKLNATGSGLVYSTYLGGTDGDDGVSIAVDTSGDAFVTGTTVSVNFPTTAGALQAFGGAVDAFVTVVDSAGSGLVYSTFLGGSGSEEGRGIAIDSFASAYVTGRTDSANFPITAGSFQTTFAGGPADAYVSKIIDVILPPAQAGKVTGGGTVDVTGGKANFGFIVQREVAGGPAGGHLSYNNHVTGTKVRSVVFTLLTITGNTAIFGGSCTNNGASCTFSVTVGDNGEPGASDTFTISISSGSPEGGTLRSGNIQIHQ